MYGNEKLSLLKRLQLEADKKTATPDKKKNLYSLISRHFTNIFNIDIDISGNHNRPDKKAWIEAGETGNKIVLNIDNINATDNDFVHEYLHLFLFALKYFPSTEGIYEKLLVDFKELKGIRTTNILEIEEAFVEHLTDFMVGNTKNIIIDYESFKNSFNAALTNIGLNTINEEYNIYNILNKKMQDIFPAIENHALNNTNLLLFEANFRDWLSDELDNSKIEINCGNG